ncbi:MAG: hypothetical protein MZV70_55175 [Desulfobacterales bacterium]|nr:hypothetical protein [Desulfobacterales bacterium]
MPIQFENGHDEIAAAYTQQTPEKSGHRADSRTGAGFDGPAQRLQSWFWLIEEHHKACENQEG